MDTYLMKNDEQMQVEGVQRQHQPAQYQQQQYPQPQYQQNQYPQQQHYPPQRGAENFRGRGQQQRGGFGRGRGQVVCYNCGSLGHFSLDYKSHVKTCTYCK